MKAIHIPTEAENQAAIAEFITEQKQLRQQRQSHAQAAHPALARLVHVCAGMSGQSFKVRALLYSLWNGQPADLSEVLNLDLNVRADVCAVILAFGYESSPNALVPSFFYDAISNAFKSARLYDWFLEEFKGSK
jgi:hypothetical protein